MECENSGALELTHAMGRCHWNVLGLCETRLENFGDISTDDGHMVSVEERTKMSVTLDFLCIRTWWVLYLDVFSRLMWIRLKAVSVNITIIYKFKHQNLDMLSDGEVDHFYQQLRES